MDTPPLVYTHSIPKGISMIGYILISFFITLVLILYLCFHYEPDIKSTGVPLSLFIFVACYLMIFFPILLAVRTKPGIILRGVHWFDDLMCTLLIWSSCIELYSSCPCKSKVSQARKCNSSSDFVLAIYIILILLPKAKQKEE